MTYVPVGTPEMQPPVIRKLCHTHTHTCVCVCVCVCEHICVNDNCVCSDAATSVLPSAGIRTANARPTCTVSVHDASSLCDQPPTSPLQHTRLTRSSHAHAFSGSVASVGCTVTGPCRSSNLTPEQTWTVTSSYVSACFSSYSDSG